MDPEVGPVDGDEALAEVAERRFVRVSDARFGQHDADRPLVRVDDLAVPDLVLDPTDGIDAKGRPADAQFWRPGHLGLREEAARRGIPAGEVDAGRFTDETATAIAPDEILGP